ncbi:MAG: ABC transporter substrate-binding protein [Chloroflexi bacterium]|nr:ABC transporter substrate-binding protein [Chloroflexota bacterium]
MIDHALTPRLRALTGSFLGALFLVAASCAPAATPAPAPVAGPAPTVLATQPSTPAPTAPAAPRVPALTPIPTPLVTTPTPTPVGESPKAGGVLRFLLPGEAPSKDPHTALSPNAAMPFIYETFLRQNPVTGAIEPLLVARWEIPSETEVVLHVRPGVRFQNRPPVNGRTMTAADVAYSLQRIGTNDPRFFRRSQLVSVTKIEALDDSRVRVTFKEPFAPFLTYLADSYNEVVPKEAVEKFGNLEKVEDSIGTGPFVFERATLGVGGSLKRNPDYWQKGKPYLDGAMWSVIPDAGTQVAAYRTTRLDMGASFYGGVSGEFRNAIRRTNPAMQFYPVPDVRPNVLTMNVTRKPFDDIRVRKAIHLAVDRQEIIQIVMDGSAQISGPIGPRLFPFYAIPEAELAKMPGFRPKDTPGGQQDIAEAKKLLAEAGYPNGLTIEADGSRYSYFTNLQPMELAKNHLRKIGITVNITLLDQASYLAEEKRNFNFRARGFTTAVEVDAQLSVRHSCAGSRNFTGFCDPDMEKLIAEQRRTLDPEKRKAIVLKAQYLLIDKVPQVFLFEPNRYAVMQPWVRGAVPSANLPFGYVENVWFAK